MIRKFQTKVGFTLAEILVTVVISSFLLITAIGFYRKMSFQFQVGIVDLKNFQEAHVAISYLRRDFSMSCPYLSTNVSDAEMKEFILKPMAIGFEDAGKNNSKRIQILLGQIKFYKFSDYNFSSNKHPKIEKIEYEFHENKGTLERKTSQGSIFFSGFENVGFYSYVHPSNPRVPILWVRLIINHDKKKLKGSEKPLIINTSIVSNFAADVSKYPYWNYNSTQIGN